MQVKINARETVLLAPPVIELVPYQGLNLGLSLTGRVCYHYTIGQLYHHDSGYGASPLKPPLRPPPQSTLKWDPLMVLAYQLRCW